MAGFPARGFSTRPGSDVQPKLPKAQRNFYTGLRAGGTGPPVATELPATR